MVSSTRQFLMLFAAAVLLFTTSRAAPIVKRQATDHSVALKNYALGLFVGSQIAVSSINLIMLKFDYIRTLQYRTLLLAVS